MTYDQLIEEFNNRFASGNPAQMNVSENSVYAALMNILQGEHVVGFGKLQLETFTDLYDEDRDVRIHAHQELILVPDAVLLAGLNTGGAPALGSLTSDVRRVASIIMDSLAKGEEISLEGYGVWATSKMAAFSDNGVVFPAKKYPLFIRDTSFYRLPNPFFPSVDQLVFPIPDETVSGVWQYSARVNGGWAVPYKPCLRRPPALPSFTQAEFNTAVAANVAASLQAQVVPLQNQITTLNAQILALQQASAGNLQPLINAGLILQPERRVGTYTIKDFTVLNAIYRAGAPTYFIKKDLDFINVQLLSIRQAVQKMYQVAVAKDNDLNMTAIYRTRQDKRKEYAAKVDTSFVDFLYESVRVMNYAVDEVRFNQKFNLLSPTLVRDLDVLP